MQSGFRLTQYIIFGLFGICAITIGQVIPSFLQMAKRVPFVAVAVSAIMFTSSGTKLRTSPNCEKADRNVSPLQI